MKENEIVSNAVDDIEHGKGEGAWNVLPGSWQNEMSKLSREEQLDVAQKIVDQVSSDKSNNSSLPDVSIDYGINAEGKTVDNLVVDDGSNKKVINIKTCGQHFADAGAMVEKGADTVMHPDRLGDKFKDWLDDQFEKAKDQ